jgi:porin
MKDDRLLASFAALGLAVLIFASPVFAQDEEKAAVDDSQSGYSNIPVFGGPDGVSAELARNDKKRDSTFAFDGLQRAFAPYFAWKRQLNDDHGVSFGFQYYLLPQRASSSLGDDDALGSIFRFQGTWTLFGRDGDNPGRIEWRVENRSDVFGRQSPNDLSGQIGAAALNTGFGYSSNFSTDLAVLNWTQGFNNSTAGAAMGRLAFDVYLDAMPFQTFSRGFINRAFLLNPTIGTTGIGAIGAVAKGFITDQIWIGGQMHDGNAASGDFDWDTDEEGEWLTAVEIGWSPSFADRKKQLVQFTYWHKDARSLAGVPKGSGWAVSAAYQLNETYFPFVRFGHSDGGAGVAAEDAISAGVEITQRFDEIWSIGAGWANPSETTFGPGLSDEWVIETSYKFQLSKNFSLTPDVQIIFNPANNPVDSSSWVVGVRAILTL